MNPYGPYFTEKELKLVGAPDEIKEKVYLLIKLALTPIRKKYGPVTVTSVWRSPEKQEAMRQLGYNPSPTSQHLTGEAIDFIIKGQDMRQVFEDVRQWWPGQLFYYKKKGHVHIGLPTLSLQERGRLYSLIRDE